MNDAEHTREQKQRTTQQNRALHKYCTEVASLLNEHGVSMTDFVRTVEIDHSMESVKELWRTIARRKFNKGSTADLTTKELDAIYEEVNRHIAQWGVHVPFPSNENSLEALKSFEQFL